MKEIDEIKIALEAHKCYIGNNEEYYLKSLVTPILSSLEKVISNRLLCPECLQMLEPDGSCLTCRFKEELEKVHKKLDETEKLLWDCAHERLDLSDTLEKEREKVEKARLELDFNREIRSSLESLGEDLEKRIQTLQKYLKESQDHCKELEVNLEKEREKADKFDLALQSLTPCGSEFAHDPERCVEYVKEVRNHQQELIKKFVRRAKEAEEQVEKLILSKQDIEGQLEILRPEYKGLQERGKDLQEHNSKLGLLFVGQTEIRVGLEERVRELEAILASIKADPSIGKLEIVNGVEDG